VPDTLVGSRCAGFLIEWAEAVWNWYVASCFHPNAPLHLRPL